MKLVIAAIISLNSMVLFASELKSPKLRELTCKTIAESNYYLERSECLKGNIKIVNVEKVSFQNKDYVIAMDTKAYFQGSDFEVTLKRGLELNDNKIVLTNWTAKLTKQNTGDFHILVKTSEGDSNTKLINRASMEMDKLPKSVLNWKANGVIDFNAEESSEYNYYYIYNNDNVLIGYMVYVWFESEENDIKGYESQNFDIAGNLAGDGSAESWGYHE